MEFTPKFKEEIIDKLNQISESIEIIQERCKDYLTVDDFLQSPWGMTIMEACIMRLQVIGETIRGIDDKTHQELLPNYPQVPWRKIIGLRNIISHEYANIDYDIIWVVIDKHLSTLYETIKLVKQDMTLQF